MQVTLSFAASLFALPKVVRVFPFVAFFYVVRFVNRSLGALALPPFCSFLDTPSLFSERLV